ncbi:MAG: response regulator [Thaumarchaeota archaeon]|nr:response regulator [Nitrososphaerota archaeon]MBI3639175.1 response regulator [Nitrososphaerota archaeon]
MIINNKNEPITVIVVDDDIDTLDVFCEYLDLYQFRVVGKAHNGEKVAELYSTFKPDVVFLDVMMDTYDGIYALEQIKKINPDAIVIMVTADLTKETAEILERLHASSIIYKPFDIKKVINTVKEIIDSQRNNKSNLKQLGSLVQSTELIFSVGSQKTSVIQK